MIVTRPLQNQGYATAVCGASDAVGDLVAITGAKSGADYTVAKADPTNYNKIPAVGVILSKLTSTRAVVQFGGEIKGVYSGLTPGKVYWVSLTGRPTLVPPVPSSGQVYVQSIGVAVDSTVLRLEPAKTLTTRTA